MQDVLMPGLRLPPRDTTLPQDILPDMQQRLLQLAQAALAVAVDAANAPTLGRALEMPLGGSEPAAVFVTLTEDGALRGCIGTLEPDRPLSEAVVASVINAALGDPRFRPITAGELPAIHIEISVLGRPVPIVDPDAFQPGVDGVIVERNGRRALLLPEVARSSSGRPARCSTPSAGRPACAPAPGTSSRQACARSARSGSAARRFRPTRTRPVRLQGPLAG